MPTHIPNGFLLAIEGIDGAGKTTQAGLLSARLTEAGIDVVRTKEPTDGPWGRKIRASAFEGRLSPSEELDYFIRDRREHVETLLKPSLREGKLVIVDRYYFSTIAYQGARGMDPEALLKLNEDFAPTPNLLVLLTVDPKIGLQRIRKRGDKANHFETETSLRKVASIFEQLSFSYLHRVNANLPPEDIAAGILDRLYSGPLSTCDSQTGELLPQEDQSMPCTGELWNITARISDQRSKKLKGAS
ncbi:dTMP kinase [Hyalangium sp.]|uniref:dTMP kinase n=1 Tax=Hyalangium sp. TaxID=2028555 RepID=UPI002D3CEC5C|nr:dTMP kinase [Hyalangium sp.]HYH95388.1 dTMP kinase [Hyalangium sp.]